MCVQDDCGTTRKLGALDLDIVQDEHGEGNRWVGSALDVYEMLVKSPSYWDRDKSPGPTNTQQAKAQKTDTHHTPSP